MTPKRVQQVTRVVERAGLNEQTLSALRQAFPEMHFTWCMDGDIGAAAPFHEADGFNLYLVDGRGHCMSLTADLSAATGLVLAETDEG